MYLVQHILFLQNHNLHPNMTYFIVLLAPSCPRLNTIASFASIAHPSQTESTSPLMLSPPLLFTALYKQLICSYHLAGHWKGSPLPLSIVLLTHSGEITYSGDGDGMPVFNPGLLARTALKLLQNGCVNVWGQDFTSHHRNDSKWH